MFFFAEERYGNQEKNAALKKTASKSDIRKMKTQEQILKMKKREQKEIELTD